MTPRLTLLGFGLVLGPALTPLMADQAGLLTSSLRPTIAEAPNAWQEASDEPGYLGISYAIAEGGGVQVTEVRAGTPAERCGLQGGDVIIVAGDRKVKSDDELLEVLANHGPGSKLVLGVRRGEETLKLKVVLASRENPAGEADKSHENDTKAKDKQEQKEKKKEEAVSSEEAEIRTRLKELGYFEAEAKPIAGAHAQAKEHAEARAQDEATAALEALRGLGYVGNASGAQDPSPQEASDDQGFLGVYPSDSDRGVRIDSLVDDGAAESGGLRAGDVLLTLDGEKVTDSEALRRMIAARKAGDKVQLKIARGDAVVALNIALGARAQEGEEIEEIEPPEEPILEEPVEIEVPSEGAWDAHSEALQRQIAEELRALEQEVGGNAGIRGRIVQDDAAIGSEADELRRTIRSLRGQGEREAADRRGNQGAAEGRRGFLGVLLEGLTVTSTVEGSGARGAGIRAGETITHIDGQPVETLEDLQRLLAERRPGIRTTVSLSSDGERRQVEVVLGAPVEGTFVIEEEAEDKPALEPDVVESLTDLPQEARGYLGVGLAEEDGQVTVTQVLEGTPAQEAGIQVGDRITHIGRTEIHTINDLREALAGLEVGEAFGLAVERDGSPKRVRSALAPRPGAEEAEAADEGTSHEERAERFRLQTERNLQQAERNREQAERNREQLERNREQADRSRAQAERNREQAERDRERQMEERAGSDIERRVQRLQREHERELRELERRFEERMKQMQREFEKREKDLVRKLEQTRKKGGSGDNDRLPEARVGVSGDGGDGDGMIQGWVTAEGIPVRSVVRMGADGWSGAEGVQVQRRVVDGQQVIEVQVDGKEQALLHTDDQGRFVVSGRRRGVAHDAPAHDGPSAEAVDNVRATLKALRTEVEALRKEVSSLRARLGDR